MRVLVVEDDGRVAAALDAALRRCGYETLRAGTVAQALAAPPVDLVLLDFGLPDGDGIEICKELRKRGDVAIIAVTARGGERELVAGLRSGADDYVVKPFKMAELHARIDAVMRRAARGASAQQPVSLGPMWIDFAARRVTVDNVEVALTRKEYELLAALALRPGDAVTREQLLAQIWHTTWAGNLHTIEVHVASLRAKLGDGSLIQTVRGVGYRLRPTG
jgi:DNA-binding response OmpR family regulator